MEASKIVRPAILDLVEKVTHSDGIDNYNIIDVKTNQKGEGFVGDIFVVTVKDATSEKQLDMVIKAAFTDKQARELLPIRMAFQNEIYFYTEVYPKFKELEKSCGVTKTVDLFPKCLMMSLEDNEEMLALENLKTLGFEIFDKKEIMDDAHIELTFKTYGRFHAYSYTFRDQKPEEYIDIVSGFYKSYASLHEGFFANYLVELAKLVEKNLVPGEDDEIIRKFKKYSGGNIVNIFANAADVNCDYSAIIHGDAWSNNMLFLYEGEGHNKKPVNLCLIDMQITKVGSPVCDLSYLLYTGGSKKNFDNFDQYLKIYYDSLSSFMKKLGSDPEVLFPFSALKEHWKKYARWGMIFTLSTLKMKLTEKEDITMATDGFDSGEIVAEIMKSKFSEEEFCRRIRAVLWHMNDTDAL